MSEGAGSVGVFTTDLALIIQSWDAWIADATGISESDARGRSLTELFPELETRGLASRLTRVGRSGSADILAPAFHEYLIPCAPRTQPSLFARMQQHVVITPLRAGERVAGIIVTIEDVTIPRARERELAAQLRSADDAVRLQAVRTLAADKSAPAALAGVLDDDNWRVRRAAVDGLSHARDDTAVDLLLTVIRERHRDLSVLNAALTALVKAECDVLPGLATLLDVDDADVRTYSALALGLLQDPRAVHHLLRLVSDDDANVRFHAVEALGRIGSREAALPMSAIAESGDFSVAFAALDALALIGEPSVAPRLVPLLEDPMLREAAAETLGRLGDEHTVSPLAALLVLPGTSVTLVARSLATIHERFERSHRGGAIIINAARAAIGASGALALTGAHASASDTDLDGLVVVLGWLEGADVDEAIARLLLNPRVRKLAAETLAKRGANAVSSLVAMLDEDDDEVRKAAATALGRIGAARAVPSLLPLLTGASDVAVVAAGALGAIGDDRAFEPLIAQLDHSQAGVRQASIAALNSIGHADMPARAMELLRDASPRVREAAVRVAGYRGADGAVDAILALRDDADESVRRAATEQLSHFEDPRAHAAIAQDLHHASAGIRAAAARSLAHVHKGEAIPLLVRACVDADPWVRYYAARSIGHHGRSDAVSTLVSLALNDPVSPVRIAAIEALAEIGDSSGIVELSPLVGDPDAGSACPAMRALAGSTMPGILPTLLEQLASADRSRRLAALEAIRRHGDAEAVPVLASVAADTSDPELAEGAVRALGEIGGATAMDALVAIAQDPRRDTDVLAALDNLDEQQVPHVARGLSHPSVDVRCTIIEALSRARSAAVVTHLTDSLHDADPAVHLAATYALDRIARRRTTPT
ncbi:MAG: HEAT repeat domain-containing protein [Gemmatimonadota bacterium]